MMNASPTNLDALIAYEPTLGYKGQPASPSIVTKATTTAHLESPVLYVLLNKFVKFRCPQPV